MSPAISIGPWGRMSAANRYTQHIGGAGAMAETIA